MVSGKIRIEQFAFRAEHSTTLQLLKLTNQLCINSNNNLRIAVVFMDIEKGA